MKQLVLEYLKDCNYDLTSGDSKGINISLEDDELLIKGSKLDLIELADYVVNVAISDVQNDHIHLDDLTLIGNNSSIKSLIIEKKDNKN